jgi:hypothetical protein
MEGWLDLVSECHAMPLLIAGVIPMQGILIPSF